MPDLWVYHLCSDCRSLYLVDRPDDESLPRAYADYYTHNTGSDPELAGEGPAVRLVNGYLNARFGMQRKNAASFGWWFWRMLPPFRMKLDVYGRHVPPRLCNEGASLLDVGCGSGTFLLRAAEMGLRVQGCEPDPVAVETGRRCGLTLHAGDIWSAGFADGSFDYITLNHVIEHVTNAPALLDKLHQLLKPGGLLWLALPNPGALGRIWFKRAWKGFHPPYHLLIPSQKVLRSWLGESGFTAVQAIRRGVQSPGLWRESIRIANREELAPYPPMTRLVWRLGDVLSSFSTRWSEETILLARRTGGANDG